MITSHPQPSSSIIGRVLLSYLDYPLTVPKDNLLHGHSNAWESREIVYIFNRLGYIVDVIDWSDENFYPTQRYDVVMDIYSNLQRLAPMLPKDTLKILHLTGSYHSYQRAAEYLRVENVIKRRGQPCYPKRSIGLKPQLSERSLQIADVCSLIGNDHTLNTYPEQYRQKIKKVTVSASYIDKIKGLDEYVSDKRHFLWFFGAGVVNKGLDLVLEAFSNNLQIELHIVGNVARELDFFNIYKRELTEYPNIHYHGYLLPNSQEFKNILKDVFCFIAPSCSEAISTAVVTCMQIGLYPIISRDTGATLPLGCGKYLEKCTIEEIEQAVLATYNMTSEELSYQTQQCQQYALNQYSRETFSRTMTEFLCGLGLDTLSEDAYDIAYRKGWESPQLHQFFYQNYKTPDLVDNARRFYNSEEMQETIHILSPIIGKSKANMKVLVFGCGNGIAAYALARAGYTVVGMDVSCGTLVGINAARQLKGVDGVDFEILQTNKEKICCQDDFFDIVYIRETLHQITQLDVFLDEVSRVLKPNGIICCMREIVIWNEEQRQYYLAENPFKSNVSNEGCYYLSEYISAFKKAGFQEGRILDPLSTIINTYPEKYDDNKKFNLEIEKKKIQGYNIFSFIAKLKKQSKVLTQVPANDDVLSSNASMVNLSEKTDNIKEDKYDRALLWGWQQPNLRELIYLCYQTPNYFENARRYCNSDEFCEVLKIIKDAGKEPNQECKILDFGCGNGVATYSFAKMGYNVTGIDSSLGYVAGINAAKKIQGLDGVDFVLKQSKGETIEFPDNTFDVVWMRQVLHHIKDMKGFLMEIARILKPEGIVFSIRDHVIWNEEQRKNFYNTHPFHHITQDEGCYYLEEYLEAFTQAGLSVERVINPYSSIINTFPIPVQVDQSFDENVAKERQNGNDLFSFLARKIELKQFLYSGVVNNRNVEKFMKEIPWKVKIHSDTILLDAFKIQFHVPKHSVQMCVNIGEKSIVACNFIFESTKGQISVGKRTYIGHNTNIISRSNITIGDDVVISYNCYIYDHNSHAVEWKDRADDIMQVFTDYQQSGNMAMNKNWDKVKSEAIIIKNKVWIGFDAVILKGVTIGEGAVIGAKSVVVKDVEPWTVVAGNPARVVKKIDPQ